MVDGEAIVVIITDDGVDGNNVQLVQFVFITLPQIVTLVQQNTPESKVKRLNEIEFALIEFSHHPLFPSIKYVPFIICGIGDTSN